MIPNKLTFILSNDPKIEMQKLSNLLPSWVSWQGCTVFVYLNQLTGKEVITLSGICARLTFTIPKARIFWLDFFLS